MSHLAQYMIYGFMIVLFVVLAIGAMLKQGRWLLVFLSEDNVYSDNLENKNELFRCVAAMLLVDAALAGLGLTTMLFYGVPRGLLVTLLLPVFHVSFSLLIRARNEALLQVMREREERKAKNEEEAEEPETINIADTAAEDVPAKAEEEFPENILEDESSEGRQERQAPQSLQEPEAQSA